MLVVPLRIRKTLLEELAKAQTREIGGVMMGEQLEPGKFLLKEITIQRTGGTFSYFIREAKQAIRQLRSFFTKTDRQYTRYNYLGEWHSHPSFSVQPSGKDHQSMIELLDDEKVGATFLLLLITKLSEIEELEFSLHLYTPPNQIFPVEVCIND